MLSTIFLIAALVLFVLAGMGVPSPTRFQFIGWGLAFWVASILVGSLPLTVH